MGNLFSRTRQIAFFALSHGLPTMGSTPRNQVDIYRQAGVYVGRILNGDKPASLPIMQTHCRARLLSHCPSFSKGSPRFRAINQLCDHRC